jgi:hypothetical protein
MEGRHLWMYTALNLKSSKRLTYFLKEQSKIKFLKIENKLKMS